MKSQINVFGCGGAGIKAASRFENMATVDGVANINCYYLDTGSSNIDAVDIPKESCYIFECKDSMGRVLSGAGKSRALVATAVANNINQVLEKFVPVHPLNIIVMSGGGGSGSVIGPYLAEVLQNSGYPTMVILIGSHESNKSIDNTINTIYSLDNFARETETPIIMSFHNNQANLRLKEVDKEVNALIGQMAILCSNMNVGLDSEDIKHFLQFNKVTSVEPQLACIEVVNDVDSASQVSYPVAIASLLPADTVSTIGKVGAEYYCDGTLPNKEMPEMHFVINVTDPTEIISMLQLEQQALQKRTSARPKTQPLGGNKSNGGLVL